jgi:hypothetical protein
MLHIPTTTIERTMENSLEPIDLLILASKSLYDERVAQQRREIESLKKELEKSIRKKTVWIVNKVTRSGTQLSFIMRTKEEAESIIQIDNGKSSPPYRLYSSELFVFNDRVLIWDSFYSFGILIRHSENIN